MKNLLKLILIGILCMLFKKSPAQFKITSNDLFLAGTQFIGGGLDGVREQVLYHPNELFKQHQNLNRQYWDSRISWQNKEHVWTPISDANHVLRLGIQTTNLASIAISLTSKEGKNWKVILKKILISYLSNKSGFYTIYNLHFKNK
jgi:hypothetical protein